MLIVRSNVVLVLPNLNAGGAQRVMLNLANELSVSMDLTLALVQPVGELIEQVASTVRVVDLGGGMIWLGTLTRLIWRERPQAVLSTLSDVNIGILLIQSFFPHGVRVVVREALMPSEWINYWHCSRLMKVLYRYTHKRAKYVIVLSQMMRQQFISITGLYRQKVIVIPNSVGPARLSASEVPNLDVRGPYLIAVGRLSRQKGFDVLVEAFARLNTSFSSYRLVIVGEGEERARLEALIEQYCLSERVILTGFVANPLSLVRRSVLFVLSSHVEGMPNVLIEALCVGTPALATLKNTSADEIITEGKNGFLVSCCEVEVLTEGLQHALCIAPYLDRLSIMQEALTRFSFNMMIENYRKVLLG